MVWVGFFVSFVLGYIMGCKTDKLCIANILYMYLIPFCFYQLILFPHILLVGGP